MKFIYNILTPIIIATISIYLLTSSYSCDENLQQQSVTVSGTILGEDGANTPVTPVNFELTHNPPNDTSPRLIDSEQGMQNQQMVTLNVARTGIPLTEEYWYLNFSRVEIRIGSGDPPPTTATGAPSFVLRHTRDLAVLALRPDLLDSPLRDSLVFQSSLGIRLSGQSILARVEEDDPTIPFNDPSAPIDISRITTGLQNTIGAVVTTSVNSNSFITMGGADNAGDFRLYFLPHVLHSTLSNSDRDVKGVGFMFRFTANVTIGINIAEFKVYIPISILLEPAPTTNGGQVYQAYLDPFSMIGGITPPDNLNRITVVASGLFDVLIANQVRSTIVSGIDSMTTAQLNSLEFLANGLAGMINSFRDGNPPIPENWDVLLYPEQRPVNGMIENLVSPAPGGVAVRMSILE